VSIKQHPISYEQASSIVDGVWSHVLYALGDALGRDPKGLDGWRRAGGPDRLLEELLAEVRELRR